MGQDLACLKGSFTTLLWLVTPSPPLPQGKLYFCPGQNLARQGWALLPESGVGVLSEGQGWTDTNKGSGLENRNLDGQKGPQFLHLS